MAASFHQLPSLDRVGFQGKVEDLLVRRGLRNSELVTTPSDRAAEELRQLKIGLPLSVQVEHNLIAPPERIALRPRAGHLHRVRLLFAGRLTEQKGLDRIPELIRSVGTPVHIRCFGDGEEADRLRAMFRASTEPHIIELHGHTDDITSQMDWCDALFMPSRWELNPLLVWEGRARGRPTVASRIEVFEDLAESGPVYMFNDGKELDHFLRDFATSQPQRESAYTEALESFQGLDKGSKIVEFLQD